MLVTLRPKSKHNHKSDILLENINILFSYRLQWEAMSLKKERGLREGKQSQAQRPQVTDVRNVKKNKNRCALGSLFITLL